MRHTTAVVVAVLVYSATCLPLSPGIDREARRARGYDTRLKELRVGLEVAEAVVVSWLYIYY